MASRKIASFFLKRDRRKAFSQEQERVRACVHATPASREGARANEILNEQGLPHVGVADDRFVLGTDIRAPDRLVTLARAEVVASHTITYGATGMGKTVGWLQILDQELRRLIERLSAGLPPETAIMVAEPKHDFSVSFRALLEHRLRDAPDHVREHILSSFTVFNPLGRFVVPLPLLTPDEGVPPELHATALSGLIGRLSGSPFGAKQRPILDVCLLFFILEQLGLLQGLELLGDWERLRHLVRRSPSPIVRSFFQENARVPAGSLDGIRARLMRLVFAPNLRAMFSAREGLNFDELVRPGCISIMDLGGSHGDEDLTAFFCGLVMLKLGRAIRKRPNGASPVVIVMDEFQRILHGEGDVAEQTATFLEVARSRGAALHLLTQSPTSLSSVSPRLLRAIHTNAGLEIIGATDDAQALSNILPVTGRRTRRLGAPWEVPSASPWLSRDEETRILVEETQALPPRHFWVRAKRRMPKAVLTRTLDFPIPESRNDELAARIERGRWGRLPAETQEEPRPRITVLDDGVSPRTRRPRGL